MYYCKNCKKVVKSGNVCSCGNQLTREDEIIYCPTCNKMYFKPKRSFTCRQCNTFVKVEPDGMINQNNYQKQDTSETFVNMFLNGTLPKGNGENKSENINLGSGNTANDFNNINERSDFNKQDNGSSFNHGAFSNSQDMGDSNFNHGAFVDSKNVENQNSSTNNSDSGASKDEFDISQFEDANASNGKNSKSAKKEKVKGGSSNKWSIIFGSTLFVIAIVALIYFVILPLVTPSYRLAWDSYVNGQNEINRAVGEKVEYSTAGFDVISEENGVVIAKIRLDIKKYNETSKKYEKTLKELEIKFNKVEGKYIIDEDSLNEALLSIEILLGE